MPVAILMAGCLVASMAVLLLTRRRTVLTPVAA